VKKLRRKTLAQDVFDNQCEIFNFIDLCSGVGIVWSTTTLIRESVMPLLSLFPLNVLTHHNFILCHETSPESGLLHTFLFIHEHLIIIWSPTLNLIAVTTLLLASGLRRC